MVSWTQTLAYRRRRAQIVGALLLFVVLFFSCLAYAYFIEPYRLVVNQSTLTIKGWNPAFDGLKIVMIGDVHGGSNGVDEEKLRLVVERTNEQNADLVMLLGDYVAQAHGDKPLRQRNLRMPIDAIANGLSGIKATYGVYAVLGNHDGWYGDDKVAAEFTRVGYKVLQNEVAVIDKNGQHLRLLGFKDHLELNKTWQQTSNDGKRLLAPTGDGDIIALEHSPDILPVITGELSISPSLKLILAAHTHGGQVWFPILERPIVPSIFGQKYAYGHVKQNDVDMFVTSGVGMSVLPIRFMVPPEIAVLTIRSEPQG